MNYSALRNAYYTGIVLLVLYALPAVDLIKTYLYPVFEFEIVPGIHIITIIALVTGVGAFAAWKYRKIG